MNEIRKEKLRIANLVDEINERGLANLSFDIGTPDGIPISVYQYSERGALVVTWYAMGCKFDVTLLEELQGITKDLKALYRAGMKAMHSEALAERQERAA